MDRTALKTKKHLLQKGCTKCYKQAGLIGPKSLVLVECPVAVFLVLVCFWVIRCGSRDTPW